MYGPQSPGTAHVSQEALHGGVWAEVEEIGTGTIQTRQRREERGQLEQVTNYSGHNHIHSWPFKNENM